MDVLIACEYSGTIRDAFIAKGHNAISCDIRPTEKPGPHYTGDVTDILVEQWDLVIAHPPCTYLCNSGVRWLSSDPTRWKKLDKAADFFQLFLSCTAKYVCIENPIMHGHAKKRIGGIQQTQIIQPWQHGHLEKKATCLWLKNIPLLTPTHNVYNEMKKLPINKQNRIHYMGGTNSKLRSLTYSGIAKAMADQWGSLGDN